MDNVISMLTELKVTLKSSLSACPDGIDVFLNKRKTTGQTKIKAEKEQGWFGPQATPVLQLYRRDLTQSRQESKYEQRFNCLIVELKRANLLQFQATRCLTFQDNIDWGLLLPKLALHIWPVVSTPSIVEQRFGVLPSHQIAPGLTIFLSYLLEDERMTSAL